MYLLTYLLAVLMCDVVVQSRVKSSSVSSICVRQHCVYQTSPPRL